MALFVASLARLAISLLGESSEVARYKIGQKQSRYYRMPTIESSFSACLEPGIFTGPMLKIHTMGSAISALGLPNELERLPTQFPNHLR